MAGKMNEVYAGITYTVAPFYQLSLDDLYAIMRLRQEVFIVEQNCPYLDADGKDPFGHHIMGKYKDGELVCYTRLLPEGVSYKGFCSIGRVINAASVRGQGQGKKLMELSIRQIKALFPGSPIKIGAQAYLKRFYESFGFVDLNQPYMEDGIPHLKMVLE
jgi:ElaA protein